MSKYDLFDWTGTGTLEIGRTQRCLSISRSVGMPLTATALSLLDTKPLGPEGGVGSI